MTINTVKAGLPVLEGFDPARKCSETPVNWEGHDFQSCRKAGRKKLWASAPEDHQGRSEGSSTFLRWCKFNFVGGIGVGVQFAALFLLKGVFRFNYLAATAVAVEAAVLHNFVWHEQFTWVDRVKPDRFKQNRIRTRWRASLPRFLRFNLTNGAVSILGNLALMKVMVGQGHMHYLAANGIAITLCSLANFLMSDAWVFEQ